MFGRQYQKKEGENQETPPPIYWVASQFEPTYRIVPLYGIPPFLFPESGKSFSESSQRDPFGRTLAMLASTHAQENSAHPPPHKPAVFLPHASPLRTRPPIPSSTFRRWSAQIVSVRYDFDVVLLSQKLISFWLRLLFLHLLKISKSGKSNIVRQDSMGPPTRLSWS
jgi:hypothetical protein